ncbi:MULTISPECIES: hypothetical protein [unclassified Ensifer]|uniref:hypothetical protein n=1 Tax=unclassified Ensifer TaxID=2633371 RepID=UPI0011124AF1|nr:MULTISPECIES: hypothetical protein [unclassified Ensifer]
MTDASFEASWQTGEIEPEDVWYQAKGLGLLSLAALHFARNGIAFNYYDIGSNIGMAVMAEAIFQQRCRIGNQLFAFETGPNYDLLVRSIEINSLAEVISPARAIISSGEEHSAPREALSTPVTNLTTHILDDIIRSHRRAGAVVKIDADGADFVVIDGLRNTISSMPCVVQFQYCPEIIETYSSSIDALIELGRNCEIWEVDGVRLRSIKSSTLGFMELNDRLIRSSAKATDLLLVTRSVPRIFDMLERMIHN